MNGSELIAAERQRQQDGEGWTLAHDVVEHGDHELLEAARAYENVVLLDETSGRDWWPWDKSWWKPSRDPVRNLVKAGALIAAEIDRLQARAALDPGPDRTNW